MKQKTGAVRRDDPNVEVLLCNCECPHWGQPDEQNIYLCRCDTCGSHHHICGHCLQAGRVQSCPVCDPGPGPTHSVVVERASSMAGKTRPYRPLRPDARYELPALRAARNYQEVFGPIDLGSDVYEHEHHVLDGEGVGLCGEEEAHPLSWDWWATCETGERMCKGCVAVCRKMVRQRRERLQEIWTAQLQVRAGEPMSLVERVVRDVVRSRCAEPSTEDRVDQILAVRQRDHRAWEEDEWFLAPFRAALPEELVNEAYTRFLNAQTWWWESEGYDAS